MTLSLVWLQAGSAWVKRLFCGLAVMELAGYHDMAWMQEQV